MWFITTLVAAFVFTTMHKLIPKYRLEIPSLMCWGTTAMIIVDKINAVVEGDDFLEITTDGLIQNSIVLGLLMLIPVIIIWIVVLAVKKPRDD